MTEIVFSQSTLFREHCRLQFDDLNEHYNLNVQITALMDLVVRAIQLPKLLPGTEAEQLFENEKAAATKESANTKKDR